MSRLQVATLSCFEHTQSSAAKLRAWRTETMSTFRLFWKEALHRKWSSLATLLVVMTSVALIVGLHLMGKAYHAKTAGHVAQLDDEIRKTMKELGFNIFIFPKELNMSQFFRQDFGQETMSEELVDRLANSKDVFTINHLRPGLIRKVDWPEQNRQIILMGVSGVVPWTHRKNPKKPLAEAVPEGQIHMGSLLAQELSVEPGKQVTLQGSEFSVGKVYPPRGNEDDITAWIDLRAAQQIAGLPGRINMIQALECNCASIDRLAEIEQEISGILGDEVKVMELSTEAIARAQARVKVEKSGQENLAMLLRTTFVAFCLLTVLGSVILALLFLRNAAQRTAEIGMLRAIGVRRRQLMQLFLGKSLAFGLVGGLLGAFGGHVCTNLIGPRFIQDFAPLAFEPSLLWMAPVVASIVTVLSTWIPVEAITSKDPARILREAS